MPWPGSTGGGDPDLGPNGLLDGRLPGHLPRQAGSLGGTHRPVSKIPNALERGATSVEKDHRSAGEWNYDWRVPGGWIGDDQASQLQKRVGRQDLLQAGVSQSWCSCHLSRGKSKTYSLIF